MNDVVQEFWNKQVSSGHRSKSAGFYQRKAVEHASLMTREEREAGCVDLGCGAGELLVYFTDHVNVKTGIDYSQSMLDEAGKSLSGKNIDLINVDIFKYLPNSNFYTWTTTGAINQYLDESKMKLFLDIFKENNNSNSLFMFDCVDPVRYGLLAFGISYLPVVEKRRGWVNSFLSSINRHMIRLRQLARVYLGAGRKSVTKLPGAVMGYGYLPQFWIKEGAARGFEVDIVSSQLYEYRYHVALRKIAV